MRPWDIDDCEVAIAQLKDQYFSLQCYVEELKADLWRLQEEKADA
jgi:hypothetical protein